MLTVETFQPGGRQAQAVAASRVLVCDAHGNPLAVVVEHAPGEYIVAHLNDPDFGVLLATFGTAAARVARVVEGPTV